MSEEKQFNFIVIFKTDSGDRSFVEFDTWEKAYRFCKDSIETGSQSAELHWVNKTERFCVQRVRSMVEKR